MKQLFYNRVIHTNALITALPVVSEQTKHDFSVVFVADSAPDGALELVYQGAEHHNYGGSRWLKQNLPSGETFFWTVYEHRSGIAFTFKYYPDEQRLDVLYCAPTTIEHCQPILIQAALPIFLRMKLQTLCLHAGVLVLGDFTAAIIGPSGSGKSTLLLAAVQQRYAVISEDIAVLEQVNGECLVYPGMARLRVFANTLRQLDGKFDALPMYPLQTDQADLKQYVDTSDHPFWNDPQPQRLDAIFLLQARRTDLDQVTIEAVSKSDAVVSLLQNRFGNFPVDARVQGREIAQISELVRRVPVYALHRPDGVAYLPSTLDAIEKQLRDQRP